MEILPNQRYMYVTSELMSPTLFSKRTAPAPHQVFSSGDRKAQLIELFTAQGCEGCILAERWMSRLRHDPELWRTKVPVAFHVNYWDSLGWPDPFASPEHTSRQRLYKHSGNLSSVYTPSVVVDGKEWLSVFSSKSLPSLDSPLAPLVVERKSNSVTLQFGTERAGWLLPVTLNLALLGNGIFSKIGGGENAGRELRQDFVVLDHQRMLSGDGYWQTQLPPLNYAGVAQYAIAAWAANPVSNEVLQATGDWVL